MASSITLLISGINTLIFMLIILIPNLHVFEIAIGLLCQVQCQHISHKVLIDCMTTKSV
jgi:hypothetical protein